MSDFQNFDKILPIKIQGGTDSNEPGSVRIFEINSSIVVERLEKSDDELMEQIVLALTHFLEIDDLITNIRIFDAADEVTPSFKQSYTHCLLPVETVEKILTGICQTISGALGGAARRKKEVIET